MWLTETGAARIGMGCMRLSTERDRDEARAVAVLHAAFDAGVTVLDTADAYAWDDTEIGHNERLIARAIATWAGGDRASILVATKGGLTRPQGGWVPDGRARHLAVACDASLRALGVDRLSLYQLHVPDPRVPLATSVRALASLQRDGLIGAIGLCNVTVGQLEEARAIADIACVQVELSPWHDESVLGGVVPYCAASGIQVLAYRPLGGPQGVRRMRADPLLVEIAASRGATPMEVALAWLRGLAPGVLPIPGATRVETTASIARAAALTLTADESARLDAHFPTGRAMRFGETPRAHAAAADPSRSEVVLIMGLPAAGKSTVAAAFVEEGYTRLNRDDTGGTLPGLLPALDRVLASGAARVVLDNTYTSRASRAAVVQTAARHGLGVRCVWLATSLEDAQVNAVTRVLSRHGRLLASADVKREKIRDVAAFAPGAQFRCQREIEPPDAAEGFSSIEIRPFVRRRDPDFVHRALIVWCDEILCRSQSGQRVPTSTDDLDVPSDRGAVLRRYQTEGWRLMGFSWQPAIAEQTRSREDVDAMFAVVQERLGVSMTIDYCPHGAGPPVCWCRKPLPGLGVLVIQRHRLDPAQCLYVGAGPQDPGFARRLGFQYRDAETFFATAAGP